MEKLKLTLKKYLKVQARAKGSCKVLLFWFSVPTNFWTQIQEQSSHWNEVQPIITAINQLEQNRTWKIENLCARFSLWIHFYAVYDEIAHISVSVQSVYATIVFMNTHNLHLTLNLFT